jgi:AGZA family xanthine/uracil permease-like MFS transporter
LWIGIVIVAQAFQEVPREHAPAVAVGLFPSLAAWGLMMFEGGLRMAKTTLFDVQANGVTGIALHGMIALERGFVFTSMILAAMAVFLLEREFLKATVWVVAAVLLSFFGIIHASKILPGGVVSEFGFGAGTEFAIGYSLVGAAFFGMHLIEKRR